MTVMVEPVPRQNTTNAGGRILHLRDPAAGAQMARSLAATSCNPGEVTMRPVSIMLACTMLSLSAAQSPSFARGCRQVLESDVKITSMRVYADILANAARNGWDYTPESIVSGSKRHFEEMKLQLNDAGYEIVPVGVRLYCKRLDKLAAR
ncbi:MAG: hypothetical protein EOR45_30665 [Mesorhizobium sp.]|nr:MAG: hypothetical protein EOR45_30665 [Mesorhizobium sp.]TIQ90498.1 MAG: hypothetical protein E5X44_22075 [Mesorhizobium sp.]TJW38188.1 MAG: hypothetical protein E5X59_32160 [Mesorhizobium sp.]